MPNKFAINGYGRIGRSSLRVWLKRFTNDLDLVAINTSGSLPVSGWAYLTKYDTAYGPLSDQIEVEEVQTPDQVSDANPLLGYLILNSEHKIPVLAQRDPIKLPWTQYLPDVVIEATGAFRTVELATQHITAGAQSVVLSAPLKGTGAPTSLIGVNEEEIMRHKDHINSFSVISNASCTTNSVAPVAAVLHSKIGIKKAMLTTVHGYTDDQNIQDNSHKDLRRSRAAAQNIVPTSTGAAQATTEAITDLKGLFDGIALRVPVVTGSITDFTFIANRTTSVEEINTMFINAAQSLQYKGILAVTDEPLVSSDIIGRSESSIVDLGMTRVVDGDLVKVLAWYDNEWGYSNRLVEQVLKVCSI